MKSSLETWQSIQNRSPTVSVSGAYYDFGLRKTMVEFESLVLFVCFGVLIPHRLLGKLLTLCRIIRPAVQDIFRLS